MANLNLSLQIGVPETGRKGMNKSRNLISNIGRISNPYMEGEQDMISSTSQKSDNQTFSHLSNSAPQLLSSNDFVGADLRLSGTTSNGHNGTNPNPRTMLGNENVCVDIMNQRGLVGNYCRNANRMSHSNFDIMNPMDMAGNGRKGVELNIRGMAGNGWGNTGTNLMDTANHCYEYATPNLSTMTRDGQRNTDMNLRGMQWGHYIASEMPQSNTETNRPMGAIASDHHSYASVKFKSSVGNQQDNNDLSLRGIGNQYVELSVPQRRAKRKQVVDENEYGLYNNPNRRCTNYCCQTNDTPVWRNGPLGPKTLCNACGIKYRKEEEKKKATAAAVQEKEKTTNNGALTDENAMFHNFMN